MASAAGRSSKDATKVVGSGASAGGQAADEGSESVPKVIVLLDKACLETIKTKKVSVNADIWINPQNRIFPIQTAVPNALRCLLLFVVSSRLACGCEWAGNSCMSRRSAHCDELPF